MTPDEPRGAAPPALTEQERAAGFAAEFGLGRLEHVTRERVLPGYARAGGCFGSAVVTLGWAVVLTSLIAAHFTRPEWATLVAVLAVLLAAGWIPFAVGWLRTKDFKRVFRHAGGLALLLPDEPEPRVARWSDISSFTVYYESSDESATRLTGFAVVTASGTQLPGNPLGRRRRERRALVEAALRHLEPRFGPALAGAYQSAGAVTFGDVTLERRGLWLPGGLIPWAAIRYARVNHIRSADGGLPEEIYLRRAGGRDVTISLSGRPNGLFLPALFAAVAAANGVKVTGQRARP